ncbi:MAG: D-alanyl-D-alanine carboxypeptidase, partial [Clostridiales bacterium]|nr:D-alanyl-D-alanine carboxypeptidase [Candidatus Equinaster intestinalis]
IKYIITFLLIFSIFSLNILPASAFQVSGFEIWAQGALLVSLDTEEVLYSKNADQKLYPASLTKMLVATVVLENTENLDNEKITYTETANNAILGTGSSVIGLKIGEELTARQALNCLLISSGGDVAYALAEHYGGSTEGFMQMMNDTAQKIGMTASHFGNPVGLHDNDTYTTPHDIYLLAKYALKYKDFEDITSTRRYTLEATNMSRARTLSTTNFLTDPSTNYYYKYAKGIKTGFTDEAGRCVVSTASYGGYNYICVIMNCQNTDGRRHEFLDSQNLYRWAFNNFEYKSVLDTTKPAAELPVELSLDTDHIELFPKTTLNRILPKNADASTISLKVNLNCSVATAPVAADTVFGTADVIYAGETIGQVELVSKENISSNIFLKAGRFIKDAVKSTAFKIIVFLIIAAVIIFIIIVIFMNRDRKKRRKVKYVPYDKK